MPDFSLGAPFIIGGFFLAAAIVLGLGIWLGHFW